MFGAKSSSRRPRPGLMSTSRTDEIQLKTFLVILSGCSLVGLFALVVIRSQLLAATSSLGDDLNVQRRLVTDLRKRLSDVTSQLNSERTRSADLTVQKDEEHAEAAHKIEVLHEQIEHTKRYLDACKDDHADARGTSEQMQLELRMEVEECRADVADLQKDLATVQISLKQQQTQKLEWKESYDAEFQSHAVTQRALADKTMELRECTIASHEARAMQHGHPPAPVDTGAAAGGVGGETAGPPGETQQPKRQVIMGSGPQVPQQPQGAVSDDPPRVHRLQQAHVDLDDDPMDQAHYHMDPADLKHLQEVHTHDMGSQGRRHVGSDHYEHQYFSDYELMHLHYHQMHGAGHGHDESHAALYEEMEVAARAHTQPELSEPEGDAVGAHHGEAGELPPEPTESLRIHRMRTRTPPAAEVDPAQEQETLS